MRVWAVCGKGCQRSGVGDVGVPGSAPSLGSSEKPLFLLLQARSRGTWIGTL